MEDHRANQCAIYLTFRVGSKSSGSQQSVKPIVCLIPLNNAYPDFAADVVVRSNDRPEIAKLLYYFKIVAVNLYTASLMLVNLYTASLSLQQAGTSSLLH